MSEMRVGRPAAAKCAATRSASATLARPSRTEDRKSTRLNSSHLVISYAVFCLKQKSELAEAKERDQIEAVKAEVRQYNSTINSFAASRTAKLRENIRDEQENLHKLVGQGVPPWLKNVFDRSPLEDLLEKQRRDLASDYQAILEEISQLYQISISTTHSIQGPSTQVLVSTYAALHDLTSQSKKLTKIGRAHV